MIRVVGGEFKGRGLRAPRGLRTRPTAARVREALFDLLGDVGGSVVLDLFAGSGALGIEALSRGAREAVFVERDRAAAAALAANLARLGIGRDRARVVRGEVLGALQTALRRGWRYDLVFVDPPYAELGGWAQRLAPLLPAVVAKGGRLVVESDRRAPPQLPWPVAIERAYGDTLIRIYAPPGSGAQRSMAGPAGR